uniref:CD79a molecule n=1 Tax=Latimeria chalumnae TaxID=7897 RepID=H3ADD4_LATCH
KMGSHSPKLIIIIIIIITEGYGTVEFSPTPHSVVVNVGKNATLRCEFSGSVKVDVQWKVWNGEQHAMNVTNTTDVRKDQSSLSIVTTSNSSTLHISGAMWKDSGLYKCAVSGDRLEVMNSGTLLLVYKTAPPKFLDLAEATKNNIITVEGILLIILLVIPGTVLLCKKRKQTEKNRKQSCDKNEKDNIYEALDPADVSMYDDITRGLQATYEDVASFQIVETQLEKP